VHSVGLVDLRLDDPRLNDLIFQPGARNRGLRSPTYRAGKAVTNPCAMCTFDLRGSTMLHLPLTSDD
jgi:hypothetical protein